MALKLEKASIRRNRLDITPLIDVVFLLLIFFMLTFSIPSQGVPLNLPESDAGGESPSAPLKLQIGADGSLDLDSHKINQDALIIKLQELVSRRKDKGLIIDIHPDAEYSIFIRVLDLSKQAGVENFSIIQ